MARIDLKPGALTAPLPPVLATVKAGGVSNIITIGWTGILATNPPKTYISVRPNRHSYEMLKESREFVINLPPTALAPAVDYCGIYTGAKVNKFEKCALTEKESHEVSAPTIAECPIALECRVTDIIPMGSHDVFMADIVSVSCQESIIDAEGRMHFEDADLLAYAHGQYYSLGQVVGRFGFSTDKEKKSDKTNINTKKAPKITEKKPFYENAPKGKRVKKKPTDKNKGAPHGRRGAAKK